MSEYVYACKTKGLCGRVAYEERNGENSWPFDNTLMHGIIRVDRPREAHEKDTLDGKILLGKYKCCTLCHLPLNLAEAAKANKLLGKSLSDVTIDDDFMELLNDY